MENLSIILTKAKNELEANFCYDDELDFTGHSYFDIDGYNIEFITNEEHTQTDFIIKDKNTNNIIYSTSMTSNTTAQLFFDFLDKGIIINTAVESIQRGWQSELTESGSIIDFKDYNEYITEIRQRVAQLGIKATIEATFSGLQYIYNR